MISIKLIIVLLLGFFIAVMAYLVVRAEEAENHFEKNQDQQIKDFLKRTSVR
jgi:hypothetical protein